MAMESAPCSLIAFFHFSSMMSKAWSHEIGVNSPFLSYWPFFMRSSGLVRRSSPYMILDRK